MTHTLVNRSWIADQEYLHNELIVYLIQWQYFFSRMTFFNKMHARSNLISPPNLSILAVEKVRIVIAAFALSRLIFKLFKVMWNTLKQSATLISVQLAR